MKELCQLKSLVDPQISQENDKQDGFGSNDVEYGPAEDLQFRGVLIGRVTLIFIPPSRSRGYTKFKITRNISSIPYLCEYKSHVPEKKVVERRPQQSNQNRIVPALQQQVAIEPARCVLYLSVMPL